MESKSKKFYCSLSYQTSPTDYNQEVESGWVFSFSEMTLEEIVEIVFDYGLYHYDDEGEGMVSMWHTHYPQNDDLLNVACNYQLFVKDQHGAEIQDVDIQEINNRISYMDDLLFN